MNNGGSNCGASLDNSQNGAMKQAFDDLVSQIVNEDESIKSESPNDEPFAASLRSAMGLVMCTAYILWPLFVIRDRFVQNQMIFLLWILCFLS